jgi:hypothetical protein
VTRGKIKQAQPKLVESAPRDASTILDIKGNNISFIDAPKSVAVEPLEVKNLANTDALPFYHGGGLLPAGVNRSTRVLTPTLFARPGKWGKRAMTHEEVLKAKDFSSADIDRFDDFVVDNAFYEGLTPGKCLSGGVKALMNGGG